MIQKTNEQFWIDEAGTRIPIGRITQLEKATERYVGKLEKEALVLNKKLSEFKELIATVCNEVYVANMLAKDVEFEDSKSKGNFTFYNFDRSIKIDVAVNERITFDDMGIEAAKAVLSQFLDENISGKLEFIKDLVNDAFMTGRGKLDAKKVMGLLKYESKINHEDYQKAMKLIRDSIRRPGSKTYYRISTKQADGSFKAIELSLSAI